MFAVQFEGWLSRGFKRAATTALSPVYQSPVFPRFARVAPVGAHFWDWVQTAEV